jgi:hypothetical protein
MKHPQPLAAQGRVAERSDRGKSFVFWAAGLLLIGVVGMVPSNSLEANRALDPIVTRAPVTEDRMPVPDSVIPSDGVPSDPASWAQPLRPMDQVYRTIHLQTAGIDPAARRHRAEG